ELPGCLTQAESKQELLRNMQDALNLFLDEPEDSQLAFPLPRHNQKVSKSIVAVAVDTKIAFAVLLRKARLEQQLTQRAMAEKLNHGSIFSYQKLESSRSANPTLLKVQQLKAVLPNLRTDLLFA
ncbi:MAG TPA: type II toxin-antitoxin system HicB family antitoxin, partial [Candidatus Acidoferrum sp.]|nr:type II toxin-antitoxin system HicB family antitoxin [Candidatus Acidoferrum sp.]